MTRGRYYYFKLIASYLILPWAAYVPSSLLLFSFASVTATAAPVGCRPARHRHLLAAAAAAAAAAVSVASLTRGRYYYFKLIASYLILPWAAYVPSSLLLFGFASETAAAAAAAAHAKVIQCFMETGQFDNHGLLPEGGGGFGFGFA